MLGPHDTLITADVKHFFVVGEHRYLARMAAPTLCATEPNVVEKTILFLLQNQFVKSTMIEGERFFQVEQASGIGFLASGDISDPVFFAVMERADIPKQEVMQARRIKTYFR